MADVGTTRLETSSDPSQSVAITLEVTDPIILDYLDRFEGDERSQRALDALRVGVVAIQSAAPALDARIVEEKFRQAGAKIDVTLEIQAKLPEGAPDNVVRTVTENARTLKFEQQGFEEE